MKWCKNNTIVQYVYSKSFYYKNDQKGKTILFSVLKINIHLMNTISNPLTFYFIKSINFNAN